MLGWFVGMNKAWPSANGLVHMLRRVLMTFFWAAIKSFKSSFIDQTYSIIFLPHSRPLLIHADDTCILLRALNRSAASR